MKTILLLEDDINLSDTIKQFLTLKGYKVLQAYDGEVAEDLAYENSIDLREFLKT
jgi:DNA-binding response OmpR family regulator